MRFLRSVSLSILAGCVFVSCASQREVSVDREISEPSAQIENALGSDYLVRSGSTMKVNYSKGSRFFVERGGTLEGFPRGVKKSQIFVEKGAYIPSSTKDGKAARQVRVVEVEDAGKAYADRNQPWNKEVPYVNESGGDQDGGHRYHAGYYGWAWYGDPFYYNAWYPRCYYPYGYRGCRGYGYYRPVGGGVTSARVVKAPFPVKR